MANYRQIHTCIRMDAWFFDLEPDHKLLWVYLFSNERANLAGLYDIHKKIIAFETGLSLQSIDAGFAAFTKAGKAYYEDGWVWVPNLIKYNTGSLNSDKIRTHIVGILAHIADSSLKTRCIAYYNARVDAGYRIDTVSVRYTNGYQEQEQEHEHEQIQEQEHNGADAPVHVLSDILTRWSTLFPEKPQPTERNKALRSKAATRWKDTEFRERWEKALVRASRSSFCRDGAWFTLNWFLANDENWRKAADGNYDTKRGAPPSAVAVALDPSEVMDPDAFFGSFGGAK